MSNFLFNVYKYFLIILVIALSPILLPLWIFHAIVINWYYCSWLGKFTKYAYYAEREQTNV